MLGQLLLHTVHVHVCSLWMDMRSEISFTRSAIAQMNPLLGNGRTLQWDRSLYICNIILYIISYYFTSTLNTMCL
jgi:hypothetical protein